MDWWRNGLQLNLRIRPVGLALAAVYALVCWAARQYSIDQFNLTAGVRVAALLVCPPRLWAYLILGEYAYFAQVRIPMIDKYGLAWVVLGSACLMPAVALVVQLHRRRMQVTSETWLLSVAACAAVLTALIKLSLSHLLWPIPPANPFLTSAVRYALGDYIGILTLAPLALLWARRSTPYDWNVWRRPATVASLASLLAIGVFAALLPEASAAAKTSLQLLMAVPVIVLTCMHGWRGAAIGVSLLNLIINATTPSTGLPGSYDARTFMTQQLIAVACTALLVLGSRITHYYHQYAARARDGEHAVSVSRNAHLANEMDLRERALDLRRIADNIEDSITEAVALLRVHGHNEPAARLLDASAAHSRQFREKTSMVYPTALEQVGLYLVLQAGGIREAWDTSHRVVASHLTGDPCQMSVGLQLATYRTLTEAVSLLLRNEYGQIRVSARCGQLGGQRGILVSVALLDRHRPLSGETVTMALERLTARPLAYGGTVQCRGNRIRMVLVEAATPPVHGRTAPRYETSHYNPA